MRCTILSISTIILLFIYGCGSHKEKKIFIYDYYSLPQGKSLNIVDSLIFEKDKKYDSTYFVTLLLYTFL